MLVTRTRESAAGIVDALHGLGADVVVVPLIATEPTASPRDIGAAARLLLDAAPPRWVVFTSATAVRLVAGATADALGPSFLYAAVGTETAAALERGGVRADVISEEADATGLARALVDRGVAEARVWFPAAEAAGNALPQMLRKAGAHVTVQPVYRTVMPADAPRRLAAAIEAGIDAVTVTSGSTARNLVAALRGSQLDRRIVIACIGPRTADEAAAAGIRVDVVATERSGPGLAKALARHRTATALG
ncbi:MAG: uroporphyrinogen-III synthase [Acidobacteria bacterium]|nr:uroporphyrinogen-III synthase [Acidobacteriota bacterium]